MQTCFSADGKQEGDGEGGLAHERARAFRITRRRLFIAGIAKAETTVIPVYTLTIR